MREPYGSEDWTPTEEDLEELRKAEGELRRMKKGDARRAFAPETIPPEEIVEADHVDALIPDSELPLLIAAGEKDDDVAPLPPPAGEPVVLAPGGRSEQLQSRERSRSPIPSRRRDEVPSTPRVPAKRRRRASCRACS